MVFGIATKKELQETLETIDRRVDVLFRTAEMEADAKFNDHKRELERITEIYTSEIDVAYNRMRMDVKKTQHGFETTLKEYEGKIADGEERITELTDKIVALEKRGLVYPVIKAEKGLPATEAFQKLLAETQDTHYELFRKNMLDNLVEMGYSGVMKHEVVQSAYGNAIQLVESRNKNTAAVIDATTAVTLETSSGNIRINNEPVARSLTYWRRPSTLETKTEILNYLKKTTLKVSDVLEVSVYYHADDKFGERLAGEIETMKNAILYGALKRRVDDKDLMGAKQLYTMYAQDFAKDAATAELFSGLCLQLLEENPQMARYWSKDEVKALLPAAK